MKILQINKFYYQKGGAERYLFELSALLESHGHQVIPFAMRDAQNTASEFERFFVSPVQTAEVSFTWRGMRTFFRSLYSFEAARQLRKLIQVTRPDVAHIHNIYTQLSPSILDVLKAEHIPIVMTVHDFHLIAPNYMLWHEHQVQNLADRSLVAATLSRFHKNSYAASFAEALAFKIHAWRQSYQVTVGRFLVSSQMMLQEHRQRDFPVTNFIVLPLFTEALSQVPRYDDDGYVLYYGRLVEEKGVEVLLKAMQRLPGVQCKIVGTGPEETQLHIAGDRLPNVQFAGYQHGEALWKLVRGARAVIVPSLFPEVFGLVAIEAMACGKPVIASAIGALPEVIVDRQSGLLFPPGNVALLAEAISRVANDQVYATTLGRAARHRAEKYYGKDHHYQALMQIYQEVVKK